MWEEGLCLWYNDHDYLEALEHFNEELERFQAQIRSNCDDNHDHNDHRVGDDSFWKKKEPLHLNLLPDMETQQYVALFVFVAGCYFDTGQLEGIRKGRHHLATALRICVSLLSKETSGFKILVKNASFAVREYVSSLEEQAWEDESNGALRDAVQVTEWAIHNKLSNVATNPYQRPGYLHPSIPTRPIYIQNQRPEWCKVFEANSQAILDEYLSLQNEEPSCMFSVGDGQHRDGAGAHDSRVVSQGSWKEIVLFGSGDEASRKNVATFTKGLVQRHLPSAVDLACSGGGEVIFSVLLPHTHIRAHCAPTNLRLTAHLGLVIPEDSQNCRIRVGENWFNWKAGEMFVFDDSYEHEVQNYTDETRIVLLLRFWHPELEVAHREAALAQAIRMKNDDRLRRYNPPLPSFHQEVYDRQMERSSCLNCTMTGFQSIRVGPTTSGLEFVCQCGMPI